MMKPLLKLGKTAEYHLIYHYIAIVYKPHLQYY